MSKTVIEMARQAGFAVGLGSGMLPKLHDFAALVRADERAKLAEQPAQQAPVAEVKAKMTGGNVGIATVIHEIYSPLRESLQPGDKLYSAHRWLGWDFEQVWSERIFGVDMRFENVQDAIAFRNKLDEATSPQAQPAPAAQQEPVALEAVYETIIQWDEGGGKRSRRELARRILALYTPQPQAQPAPEIAIADAYRAGVDSGIAAEREACAQVCEAINAAEYKDDHWYHASEKCADYIRARGNT